jgi:hypothetical protein
MKNYLNIKNTSVFDNQIKKNRILSLFKQSCGTKIHFVFLSIQEYMKV